MSEKERKKKRLKEWLEQTKNENQAKNFNLWKSKKR